MSESLCPGKYVVKGIVVLPSVSARELEQVLSSNAVILKLLLLFEQLPALVYKVTKTYFMQAGKETAEFRNGSKGQASFFFFFSYWLPNSYSIL